MNPFLLLLVLNLQLTELHLHTDLVLFYVQTEAFLLKTAALKEGGGETSRIEKIKKATFVVWV